MEQDSKKKKMPVWAWVLIGCGGLAVVGIPVLGILAAVAIPAFSQNLKVAKEGATRGNLGAIQAAISIYHADNNGQCPKSLEILLPGQGQITYMESIPAEKITGSNQVAGSFDGKGGWYYDRKACRVFLNLEGTDSKGRLYRKYGDE